ncbi:MAG TPA: SRPBCC family protein [Opitutaceae bacterium]|nr:SRPBCC family protein [Opitutaceae bacterium]
MNAAFEEIARDVAAAADLPLERARTLPAGAYASADFYRWEEETLLRGDWQCLAHLSQLPKPGDFLNVDLLGEPLLVVRDKDGAVRVLSRVCPHRGMDIMPPGFGYAGHGPAEARPGGEACGHTRILLCPYHAWTFELDGRLKACPEMHQAAGFARDDFRLKSFPCEVWEGFVFVNLGGGAGPLAGRLAEMGADVAAYRLADLQVAVAREWECPFNWKVLVENFMESYHHLGIHHKTLQPTMPARDTWTERERPGYVRSHLPYRESAREDRRAFEARGDFAADPPPLPGLSGEQRFEWGLFLAPPSFLLATAPDRVIWYRLQPEGPERLRLLTTALVPAEVAAAPGFPALRERIAAQLTEFHLEDMQVCTAVQRGLRSQGAQPGRLSHLEMPIWLFQRYLAARLRGAWPATDRPAAPGQRG